MPKPTRDMRESSNSHTNSRNRRSDMDSESSYSYSRHQSRRLKDRTHNQMRARAGRCKHIWVRVVPRAMPCDTGPHATDPCSIHLALPIRHRLCSPQVPVTALSPRTARYTDSVDGLSTR
jgi:hypothetical protein